MPTGMPSGAPKFLPTPMVPVAVRSMEPLTKLQSPPPRPPCSPTRPPPCAPRPPPARNAMSAPKQSYPKAAASVPAAPAAAPAIPKAPVPPSKTAAMRKSCLKQGTKAMKVILQFPDSSKQPTVNQLWGMLAAFKPTDITLSLQGDFILMFSHVLDSDDHSTLVKKLKKVYSMDIQVLNWGTTSLLKFPLVLTRHPDGSSVTNEWLYKTISAHPKWKDVEFIQKPHFIVPASKAIRFTATVFIKISNDHSTSNTKRLLQTNVTFHSVPQHCKPWLVSTSAKQCGICLQWGHLTHHCSSKSAWCTVCASNHESSTHAAAADADPRHRIIKCANCRSEHWVTTWTCLFYRAHFNPHELVKLQKSRIKWVRDARCSQLRIPREQCFPDNDLSYHEESPFKEDLY